MEEAAAESTTDVEAEVVEGEAADAEVEAADFAAEDSTDEKPAEGEAK